MQPFRKITNFKKQTFFLLLCALLLCALFFFPKPAKKMNPIQKTGFFFDTVITITLYDGGKEYLLEECMQLCQKYENLFSKSIKDSDVSRINQAEGKPVSVSDETISLLNTCQKLAEWTDGKFDVTIASASFLWDFEQAILPKDSDIKNALSSIDYRNIVISGNTVTLLHQAQLDLGGIAKGYIADAIKSYLIEHGITSGIIDLGGNMVVIGTKPDHTHYRIGIQEPFEVRGQSIAILSVSDCSIVTSGIYERYFEKDQIYHHILDPATGYPVENGLYSVTILTEKSILADGLSTGCFLLGKEKALKLIESLSDTEAIFIDSDYQISYTSGLTEKEGMIVKK